MDLLYNETHLRTTTVQPLRVEFHPKGPSVGGRTVNPGSVGGCIQGTSQAHGAG